MKSAYCDHFYCYHFVNVISLSHKHAINKARKRGPLLDFLTTPKTPLKNLAKFQGLPTTVHLWLYLTFFSRSQNRMFKTLNMFTQ